MEVCKEGRRRVKTFDSYDEQLMSNPDLTLFDAEMRDLGKFDTTPLFYWLL